jgi:PAS domain S-box-containing protein
VVFSSTFFEYSVHFLRGDIMLPEWVIISIVVIVIMQGLGIALMLGRRLKHVTSRLNNHQNLLADQRSTLALVADSLQEIAANKQETLNGLNMLAEERQLLRTLIDALPDLIYIKDANHRFVLANTALVHYLNLTSVDELIGKSDFDLLEPELANQYYQDERAVLETGHPLLERIEPGIDRRTNMTRWFLTTKEPFHDYQGNIKGILGIGRDITKRKEAEDALQALNARLEQRLQRHV